MVSRKNTMVINFQEAASRVKFRSIFCAPTQKFKILANHNVLAHGKSYEHGFAKKHDGHKLCTKSHAESSFNRFFVHRLGNSKYWPIRTNVLAHGKVEFRSVFHAPFRIFKILAIPDVLVHGKSYDHGFAKELHGHNLCTESSFDRFFMHRLVNSKYWSFPSY
ncbi:hypothetical protein B296_00034425 [Ensete ventricosum]|uniref:Uncharacterized protein n=1 Tax=Ensete ventricosum TaxID=4639 RepID=A0A426XJI2_ENSVE|nr:hypothetical protein B296_00034425 [Ensete ventricosum]